MLCRSGGFGPRVHEPPGQTAEEVKDKLIIIPRAYTNKPRTKGTGYKGLLHNPDPEAPDDLLEGVKAIRHMHLRVIEETGFFTADEMLYPLTISTLSIC